MPLSEFLTMDGILYNYEPATPIKDASHNVTFELDVIDTKDDKGDNYGQSNPPSNNYLIKQLANLRIPKREIFHPHIFDPRRVTAKNSRSDMVENIANVVTEEKITQCDLKLIMGLLANIYSLG